MFTPLAQPDELHIDIPKSTFITGERIEVTVTNSGIDTFYLAGCEQHNRVRGIAEIRREGQWVPLPIPLGRIVSLNPGGSIKDTFHFSGRGTYRLTYRLFANGGHFDVASDTIHVALADPTFWIEAEATTFQKDDYFYIRAFNRGDSTKYILVCSMDIEVVLQQRCHEWYTCLIRLCNGFVSMTCWAVEPGSHTDFVSCSRVGVFRYGYKVYSTAHVDSSHGYTIYYPNHSAPSTIYMSNEIVILE